MSRVQPPAPRPCDSCPYRRDVPSGIWAEEEYAKLPSYDADTGHQPTGVFLCHQNEQGSDRQRVCAGWAGCHDGAELLALRLAALRGTMTPEAVRATVNYRTPVPLFDSGAAAARHGLADLPNRGARATRAVRKITRRRSDIQTGGGSDG